MGNVYFITDNARPEPMTRIRCVNEEQELQDILEKNLDLLPGDQINPDNPRRWLLIKREMSVQDHNSGQDRWSIDFFLVDQDGVPTFVECKRFNDTRSRREVIGQLLEYAAMSISSIFQELPYHITARACIVESIAFHKCRNAILIHKEKIYNPSALTCIGVLH